MANINRDFSGRYLSQDPGALVNVTFNVFFRVQQTRLVRGLAHRDFAYSRKNYCVNTGQFKKKVKLSHVFNEVTSEPTITRCRTIVRKTLKVCL
jgi:hypothetical protein